MASAFPPIDLILWLCLWAVSVCVVLGVLACRMKAKNRHAASTTSAAAVDRKLDDLERGLTSGPVASPSPKKKAAVVCGTVFGCLAFCYLLTCALIALIMGVWGASFFITPTPASDCTACSDSTCCNYNPADISFNDVTFNSGGDTIHGWTMENATAPIGNPGAPYLNLLYNHGSGANIAANYRLERYKFLLSLGRVRMMTYDYAGYGKSTGDADEESIKRSALKAYEFFKNEFSVTDNQVTMLGRSLGGTTTAHINRNNPSVKSIIIQSSFDDISKVAGSYFPVCGWVVKPVFPVSFNDDGISTFDGCWHQFHSKDDEWVPIRFGEDYYNDATGVGSAAGCKKFLEVSGPLHDDPMTQAEKDSLTAFVNAHR